MSGASQQKAKVAFLGNHGNGHGRVCGVPAVELSVARSLGYGATKRELGVRLRDHGRIFGSIEVERWQNKDRV